MTSSAAETISAMRDALGRFGTVVELDLDVCDRTGIPVSNASLLVDGRLTHHGNGYATSRDAARVGGLGELVERVVGAEGVTRLRRHAETGSRHELVGRHGEDGVVDPRSLALPAGTAWSADRPVEWVPLADVRTGERVWVPVELVASDAREVAGAPEPLVPPVTNGLGAGLDEARAVAHGLGEVLQRHTNGLRFRALDRLSPVVAEAGLPDEVRLLVARLRDVGIDPVLKHAVTELGVCSTYVVGTEQDPRDKIALTACGEAADPDPGVSLVKALLEFAHSRARKVFCFADPARGLDRAPALYRDHVVPVVGDERAAAAMRAWAGLTPQALAEVVAPDTTRSTSYDALAPAGAPPAGRSPDQVLAHLLDRLDGHRVLAATTQVGDVVVAKVLVTGLDVETLSHGRIGESGVRVSLEHDLDLVRLGPTARGEHRARVHLGEETEERLGGAAWFSYTQAARIVGEQYPQYREPGRHSVVV